MATTCSINWRDPQTKKNCCLSDEGAKNEFSKNSKSRIMAADGEYAKITARGMVKHKMHDVQQPVNAMQEDMHSSSNQANDLMRPGKDMGDAMKDMGSSAK
jgi:hypothetical protein